MKIKEEGTMTMKVILVVLGLMAAGLGGVFAIKVHLDADNRKAIEMQRQDIAAERKAIEDFQRTHPNPFKTE